MIEIHIDGRGGDTLSSLWDGLNDNLIAKFYEVDHNGFRIGDTEVQCPIIDGGTLEASFNWQSPFENAGSESKAPALAAMLQSGAITPLIHALTTGAKPDGTFSQTGQAAEDFTAEFRGRTGITKLNSTQIFSGMPPLKISVTLVFRAFRDARSEVELPYQQLWKWALPKKLSPDSVVAGVVKNVKAGDYSIKGNLETLFPSEAPTLIGLDYKGRSIAPLVIESISEPLDSPITSDGQYARLLIPVSLATLTAIDRDDWVTVNALKA